LRASRTRSEEFLEGAALPQRIDLLVEIVCLSQAELLESKGSGVQISKLAGETET
jgi:hypothetical protein